MSVKAAADSARAIFWDPDDETLYEPLTFAEGEAAVKAFEEAYASGAKTFHKTSERSRSGSSSLSDDPLQGLSEVIQNADDQGASYVRITHSGDAIEFTHDGSPAHLKNIHAISLPWLTTNEDIAETTGRFGIGLSTLQSLSDHFDFLSGPYRVRIGDPYLTWIDLPEREEHLPNLTTLRVPLTSSDVTPAQFEQWVKSWSHEGLIFLRSVRMISFQGDSNPTELRLNSSPITRDRVDKSLKMTKVVDPSGNEWNVYRRTIKTPKGRQRKAKKTADTVGIDIAFPLNGEADSGYIYAGLPVEPFPYPVLINAPLDPTTNRRAFLTNEWNTELTGLIIDTWQMGMQDLFQHEPAHAWHHVPVDEELGMGLSPCTNAIVGLLHERGATLAAQVVLRIDSEKVGLSEVFAESPSLEGIIDSDATERLKGSKWLPRSQRDGEGRWRLVWEHWIKHDQGVNHLITPGDAASLLDSPDRADEWIIRLHAALIEDFCDFLAVGLPCVVTATEGRAPMPGEDAIVAFSMDDTVGLGHTLGVSTNLSPLYNEISEGEIVLTHLKDLERLLDEHSTRALLTHLSRLGATATVDPIEVTDDQLRQIRDAAEKLGRRFFTEIGPGLGKAITIDCFHDSDGTRETARICPADAYVGRPFVSDALSWARAATTSIGWWADQRYESVLRSALEGERAIAIGARRFLTGLGASTYARLEEAEYDKQYSGDRRNGSALYNGRPGARRRALTAIGAEYTLDDLDSHDLVLAAESISNEEAAKVRRRRAAALIESIRAGWKNNYEDHSRVEAASGYHGWLSKGDVRALWLWELGSIAWLDDSNGVPTAPLDLKLRSPSNVALYGHDPSALIHPDLEKFDAQILRELGVSGEPKPHELLDTLAAYRDANDVPKTAFNNCLAIYGALGEWINSSDATRGEKSQVRSKFDREPLIFTRDVWVTSKQAFRGEPIFRSYRAFAPLGSPSVEALWRSIQVEVPNALDCANVLSEIAQNGPLRDQDVPVIVEILRYVDRPDIPEPTSHAVKKWKTLPVWVGDRWSNRRPIYSTDNSLLADAVSEHIAVWQPKAHVGQFSASMLLMMGLTPIDESAVTVTADSRFDPEMTDTFHQTAQALHDDLALNDEQMLESLTLGWEDLRKVTVHVCEQIDASLTLDRRALTSSLRAWLDRDRLRLLVRNAASLEESDDIAAAVATWFEASSRRAEDAWYRAVRMVRADDPGPDNIQTSNEIASELRRVNEDESATALAGLSNGIKAPPKTIKKRSKSPGTEGQGKAGALTGDTAAKPRDLINPDEWVFTNPDGEIVSGRPPGGPRKHVPRLTREPVAPAPFGGGSGSSATHRSYTDKEREFVGLELVRRIIESDDNRVHDLRNQLSVGADAMDDMKRFFELKVSAGAEPDTVTLEASQVERALNTPNFFLVIVSGVERGASEVKVRFIHNLRSTLTMTQKTKLEFSGVRNSHSMVFSANEMPQGSD